MGMTESNQKKGSSEVFGDFTERKFGSYIRELREAKKLDIEDLAVVLGISEKMIAALEEERLDRLPADAFVLGMLKRYSRYFKVDYPILRDLWNSRFHIRRSGKEDLLPANRFSNSPLFFCRLSRVSFLGLVFLFFASYLLTQIVLLYLPIRLGFEKNYTVSTSSPIEISGRVFGKVKQLLINGQNVEPHNNRFYHSLFLVPGPNIVEIRAINYLGKETVLHQVILFEKPATLLSPSPLMENPF